MRNMFNTSLFKKCLIKITANFIFKSLLLMIFIMHVSLIKFREHKQIFRLYNHLRIKEYLFSLIIKKRIMILTLFTLIFTFL